MELLSDLQLEILRHLGQTEIKDLFYFTGGTALSALYLRHRYSDDLDFFTADPAAVSCVDPVLRKIANQLNGTLEFRRMFGTFLEVYLTVPNESPVKMDFALDAPFRFAPPEWITEINMYADNLKDLSANKLSALFDRAESKDFVDIYFLQKEKISLSELIENAKKKHIGLENYWLAQAFYRAEELSFLPRMVKPVTLDEVKNYFLDEAKKLMDEV